MKELELTKMENVKGGSACGALLLGAVAAFGFAITGNPLGSALGIGAMINNAGDCEEEGGLLNMFK